MAAGALILDDADEAMLAGEHGAACALGMRTVVAVAEGMRASRLLDITGAHIDGCIYYGRVCLDWALAFRTLDGRVRVPTTLNIGLLDLLHPGLTDLPEETARPARELMETYVELGAEPTFTCAPYQLAGSRPGFGEHVAWAESNAIVFANSVLGARTNRYGDFCDIACAVTGRAPAAGLHLTEHRRARVVLDVSGLSGAVLASDVLYPVLGLVLGRLAGDRVAVIDGLPPGLHEDRLKAIGASAASTGAVGMFHAVGSTPEAATLADALQGEPPDAVIEVTARDLRAARDLVQTAAPRRRPRRRLRRHAARVGRRAAEDRRGAGRPAGPHPRLGEHRARRARRGRCRGGAARRRRDGRRRHVHLHGAGGQRRPRHGDDLEREVGLLRAREPRRRRRLRQPRGVCPLRRRGPHREGR